MTASERASEPSGTATGYGTAYAEGRARLTSLLRGGGLGTTPVPTCPAWRVQDVVAHLAGICADALAGRMEGMTTDAWTAAQVDARATAGLDEILDEWAEVAPPLEAMADERGVPGNQWVFDLATHEHDVRGALGVPGARDAAATLAGVEFLRGAIDGELRSRGLAPLGLEIGDGSWVLGGATPAATLRTSSFELLRSFSGRRSSSQVAALDWQGDPEPYLAILEFGPFTVPADPVIE